MTSVLPDGLITIGHSQVQHIPSKHYADILFERSHVLHSFWKVHAVRCKVSRSASDHRSQNLFWRTWSDATLARTIATSTLICLWQNCQQDIQIRPYQHVEQLPASPRSSNNPESHDMQSSSSMVTTRPNISHEAWTACESTPSSSQPITASRPRSERPSHESPTEVDDAMEVGRRTPQSHRPKLSRAPSSNNRVSYGAATARGKNRPLMNRRKSSQNTGQNKSAKGSKSSVKSPEMDTGNTQKSDPLMEAATSVFQLPSPSSWEDEPTLDRHRPTGSAPLDDTTAELVVEPNFRYKFAERIASSTNLASLNRLKKTGSVVRFADEIPANLETNEDRNTTDACEIQSRPNIMHRSGTISVLSDTMSDEDDVPSPGLIRTKSQLSMMIDEKIARHGRESFGNLQSAAKNGGNAKQHPESVEKDKLLAMAHREGVTRAGGRQPSRRFRLSEETESRYSSPSPPPIF